MQDSKFIYFLNTLCVMACLGAVIFCASSGMDSGMLAVISGMAGTIGGSITTIMLKTMGAEKADPMHDVAMELLQAIRTQTLVKDGAVQIKSGINSTHIEK